MKQIKLRARFRKISNSKECWQYVLIERNHITTLDNMVGYTQVTDWEQYTGMKDKNGKEIYESDIVEEGGTIGKIQWDTKYAKFICILSNGSAGLYLQQMKVLGNIHQNPELLG